jgi:hypothetical protein
LLFLFRRFDTGSNAPPPASLTGVTKSYYSGFFGNQSVSRIAPARRRVITVAVLLMVKGLASPSP